MSGTQPVAVYAMKVPPGDILMPAVPDFAAMFRVSMAAIDPTEEPELEAEPKTAPRATLKLVRVPGELFDDSDEEENSDDETELENGVESSDEEMGMKGGPSAPKKKDGVSGNKQAHEDDEDMSEDDAEAAATLQKIMKGKSKAINGEGPDSDLEDDDEALELEEVVICTLDPEKNCQQPLDLVVAEDERVFFKVSGTHTIHLTGNYVIPIEDGQTSLYNGEDDDEEYDLSPDEDELEKLGILPEDDESESDELDDIEDPRVTEVHSEEEVPKLVQATAKSKNKRPAEDSEDEEEEVSLDDIMAKSFKKEVAPTASAPGSEAKLSKTQLKKLKKKMKKSNGEAAAGPEAAKPTDPKLHATDVKKSAATTEGATEKKVQFAKNLEQGPTPSSSPAIPKANKASTGQGKPKEEKKSSSSVGVRDVQGVTVDDRKLGTGPAAKKGSRVELRYIAKLDDGKVFDSNKSGKPFAFKLGAGEVIAGWDIGVAGISAGGERRLVIPAHLGYGKKGSPPKVPSNAKLTFDIKCLSVN